MTLEDNKKLVRRGWEEVAGKGNLALADELYAADLVYHGADGDITGVQTIKDLTTMYRTAFLDLHIHVEEVIAEGDRAVCRVVAHGTNTGEFMGAPATGKSAEMVIINIVRIQDGKVAEEWEVFDRLGLMEQLGLAG